MRGLGWALVVAIVLAAAAVGLGMYHFRGQIYYGFDFGSVIDAVALLFVAFLIELVYSKQSADKRADTDLLLRLVEEARDALTDLEKTAQCCEVAAT
jgi:hypothetical protein